MFSSLRFKRNKPLHLITPQEAREAHAKDAKEEVIHGSTQSQYAGDFVFGAIDGVVTTFAIVAGVAGANLSAGIVLVLGIANLLADGFSMGIGNFLSIRSEKERFEQERKREEWEVENIPDVEKKEIEDMFAAKGFSGTTLKQIVETITADKERWITTMLQEEHGLSGEGRSAFKGGLITYLAFVTIGSVPLLSYGAVLPFESLAPYTFPLSIMFTAIALFATGALKTIVVARPPLRAGLETLVVGGLAAVVAYIVGFLLKDIGG